MHWKIHQPNAVKVTETPRQQKGLTWSWILNTGYFKQIFMQSVQWYEQFNNTGVLKEIHICWIYFFEVGFLCVFTLISSSCEKRADWQFTALVLQMMYFLMFWRRTAGKSHNLHLNISKTKEMIVDMRKKMANHKRNGWSDGQTTWHFLVFIYFLLAIELT